jgi:lysophospholipase
MGHSMGGCLTLLALAQGEAARFAGAVLSAPMLGLQTAPAPVPMARVLASVNRLIGRGGGFVGTPGKPFDDAFEGNILTHDPVRFARHRAQLAACPDLALGAPTWGWLEFAFRAGAWLARPANLKGVTLPLTLCSAEQDRLVDNAAQRRAVAALPNARFVNVPGALHEILMETDDRRAVFWTEFDALADRAAPREAEVLGLR